MTLTDDDRKLIAAVRTLAEEHPNRFYDYGELNNCEYFPNEGNPYGCIIGAAVRNEFGTNELDDPKYSGVPAGTALPSVGSFSSRVLSWADTVQSKQDFGKAWSEAVSFADLQAKLWDDEEEE